MQPTDFNARRCSGMRWLWSRNWGHLYVTDDYGNLVEVSVTRAVASLAPTR